MRKLSALVFLPCLLLAQEKIDSGANARIRQEESERSQVMRIAHMLTDRYGPRLTGSPNYEAAAKWAAATLTGWGLKNARLEPWDFGHPGWTNERAAGYMIAPVRENLKFEVLSWTPSTKGVLTAAVLQIVPPQGPPAPQGPDAGRGGRGGPMAQRTPRFLGPTKEELTAYLESNKAKVTGKIVFVGKAESVAVDFAPPRMRAEDAQLRTQYDPNNPNAGRGGRGGARPQDPNRLTAAQVAETIDSWLLANGALLRVTDAGMIHGEIRAFQNRTYDISKAPPAVVLRNEDYGRIERLLTDGEEVRLQFDIANNSHPEGKTTYNVVAEIPGSDKADEVVMLGGHLDSWHAATGATDNATGCSVMMEAVRLIQALGLKPRRTIRIGLWSAEEQGLLGSKAYVAGHFGSFENPKPDFSRFVAYLNVDSGTGRLRGAGIFGPPEAAAVLRAALAPFEDLGVVGASATASRATGGTDSTSFNAAGLAGIGLQQDPIEYFGVTWHTNLDTYERLVPDDLKQASTVVAALAWHIANRDEALPKFSREQMPPPVAETR
ncbi:MAG: M20/M25/M40 family metallo-hydrolase [Acidobacteriia bacterium]|nr:M20/M25/M40 family metallo-hydrolase [Terriglobia bacterium]